MTKNPIVGSGSAALHSIPWNFSSNPASTMQRRRNMNSTSLLIRVYALLLVLFLLLANMPHNG